MAVIDPKEVVRLGSVEVGVGQEAILVGFLLLKSHARFCSNSEGFQSGNYKFHIFYLFRRLPKVHKTPILLV